MNKKVVLAHGYLRTYKDMDDLKINLEKLGYEVMLVDLPLTFSNIEYAASIFEKDINQLITNLEDNEKISLVGHSAGGLVIRLFLNNTINIDKIHRCVLIATPNKGCQLAEIASRISRTFINIFQTLKSLKYEKIKKLNLSYNKNIEIGVIAGNKNDLLLGKLLNTDNDGRVEIDSALYEEAKDYIIVPLNHRKIHHDFEIARKIDNFLESGSFSQ
jgi:pimeloyl-ACP methyl ester carboxylesterase